MAAASALPWAVLPWRTAGPHRLSRELCVPPAFRVLCSGGPRRGPADAAQPPATQQAGGAGTVQARGAARAAAQALLHLPPAHGARAPPRSCAWARVPSCCRLRAASGAALPTPAAPALARACCTLQFRPDCKPYVIWSALVLFSGVCGHLRAAGGRAGGGGCSCALGAHLRALLPCRDEPTPPPTTSGCPADLTYSAFVVPISIGMWTSFCACHLPASPAAHPLCLPRLRCPAPRCSACRWCPTAASCLGAPGCPPRRQRQLDHHFRLPVWCAAGWQECRGNGSEVQQPGERPLQAAWPAARRAPRPMRSAPRPAPSALPPPPPQAPSSSPTWSCPSTRASSPRTTCAKCWS